MLLFVQSAVGQSPTQAAQSQHSQIMLSGTDTGDFSFFDKR